jgi:polyhydroxyalkanoate synthesis repressor PhaR
MVVKKYGNRRLYDTADSRYITLEELAAKIRGGADAQVIDAKSGKDLTQATLTQIVLESRNASRLLPVPLLFQLVRMGDDALGEFFGRYVTAALEIYVQAKQGAQGLGYNPLATLPFGAGEAFSRLLGNLPWSGQRGAAQQNQPAQAPQPAPAQAPAATPPAGDAVADLRRELDELKRSLKKKPRK